MYVAGKFVRLNKVGVTAAAIVLFSLVGGLAGTMYQARVAMQERARAEGIKSFLNTMLNFTTSGIGTSSKDEHSPTLDDILDETAERLDASELSGQPDIRAEVESIVGRSYQMRGRYNASRKHLQTARALLAGLYGEENLNTIAATLVLNQATLSAGDAEAARRVIQQVLPVLHRTFDPDDPSSRQILAVALNDLGVVHRWTGQPDSAEAEFRKALTLRPVLARRGQPRHCDSYRQSSWCIRRPREVERNNGFARGEYSRVFKSIRNARSCQTGNRVWSHSGT